MKDNLIILFPVITIYLFFSLALLTKDPTVYTDEVLISNAANRILNGNKFAKEPFEKQFTLVEESMFTLYGPMYIASLSIPLKLFGYSIYSVRLFSVFIGLLILVIMYLLVNKITQSSLLSALTALLVSLDMNFLRSARFGRMDILVALFSLLALFYYFIHYKTLSHKKSIFLGLLLTLSLLTHFLLGLIIILVINSHIILAHDWKKYLKTIFPFVLTPIVASLLLWLIAVYKFAEPGLFSRSVIQASKRLIPGLFIVNVVLNDRLTYNCLTFLLYFLSLFIFVTSFFQNKSIRLLLLIGAFFSLFIVVWGSVFFYAGLIPIFFIPLVVLSLKTQEDKQQKFNLPLIIIISFILLSIFQQFRLWGFYRNYSYYDTGKKVSECIPKGSHNIFLSDLLPDPYFYLAVKRNDLKLAYRKINDSKGDYMRKYLPKADYAVFYGAYAKVIKNNLTKEEIRLSGLDPIIAELLAKNTDLSCTIPKIDSIYSEIAIFKVRH